MGSNIVFKFEPHGISLHQHNTLSKSMKSVFLEFFNLGKNMGVFSSIKIMEVNSPGYTQFF